MMDRWSGILKVPLSSNGTTFCRVAASLCVSSSSKTFVVPTANVVLFNGDRVEGTGNPVIERLSDIQNIAKILVAKFGPSVNSWVIEAPIFNGPFAVYEQFIQSPNRWGEPQAYRPDGFLASTSLAALLSNYLLERENYITEKEHYSNASSSSSRLPRTCILGFSKGGVVLNQLVTELGFSYPKSTEARAHSHNSKILENQIVPGSAESLLDSITEVHYVDVGLNSSGAYLTDDIVIDKITDQLIQRNKRLRFVFHGTPRQWNDIRRPWIREEKNKFRHLLELGRQKSDRKLEVSEKTYFAGQSPDMQMHFQIIEELILA